MSLREAIMKTLILVTGANGHLGFNLCLRLRKLDYNVRALVLPNDDTERLAKLGVEVIKGDVTDKPSLEPLFAGVHKYDRVHLIHCAGIVSISSKKVDLLHKVNYEGTRNIVDLVLRYQIDRFLYVSSVHAIEEAPMDNVIHETTEFDEEKVVGDYAKSKAKTTQYVRSKIKDGLKAIIVHPSGIVGPYDFGHGHLTMMIEDYLNGQLTSRVKGGYDFVDVGDVANGVISALLKGKIGENYILSGHFVDLDEFFKLLKKYSGKRSIINVLPTWFARVSAPLAELYYRIRRRPPIYSKYSLHTIQSNAKFSYEKANKTFGYTPRPFEETIKNTVLWLTLVGRIKNKKVIKNITQLIKEYNFDN
jgi:dihydroflavonol-4-reductase